MVRLVLPVIEPQYNEYDDFVGNKEVTMIFYEISAIFAHEVEPEWSILISAKVDYVIPIPIDRLDRMITNAQSIMLIAN